MQNLQKINLSTPIQTEYSNKMSSQRGKVTPYYSKDIGNEWVVRKTPLRWQNCQSSLRQDCSLTKGKISIPRLQSRVVSSMNSTHPHIFNLWGSTFSCAFCQEIHWITLKPNQPNWTKPVRPIEPTPKLSPPENHSQYIRLTPFFLFFFMNEPF